MAHSLVWIGARRVRGFRHKQEVRFQRTAKLQSLSVPQSSVRNQGKTVMPASDAFSAYCAEFLHGSYDCVDRIVLNAFFPVGQTGGGMRSWWRLLNGDDLKLDDDHLREITRSFSRRLHAFCQAQYSLD